MAHSTATGVVLGPSASLSGTVIAAAGRKVLRVPACGRGWEDKMTMEQRNSTRAVSLGGSSFEQWRIGALANDVRPGEFSMGEFESHENAGDLFDTDGNVLLEEADDVHNLTSGDSPNDHEVPVAHHAETEDGSELLDGVPSSGDEPPLLLPGMPESGSTTYVAARELLTEMSRSMEDLEKSLSARQKDIGESTVHLQTIRSVSRESSQPAVTKRAEEMMRRMQAQFRTVEREAQVKDVALKQLMEQATTSRSRMREVMEQSRKERDAITTRLTQEKQRVQQELDGAVGREEALRRQLMEAQEGITQRDAFLRQLQEETALSASALKQAARAMVSARDRTLRIEEQLEAMGDELTRERGRTVKERQKTLAVSAELAEAKMGAEEMASRMKQMEAALAAKDQELMAVRAQASETESKLQAKEDTLSEIQRRSEELRRQRDEAENRVIAEMRAAEAAKDARLAAEQKLHRMESRARELAVEVASLKELMESKDEMMAAVRDETMKNAELLMQAARTRKELSDSELQAQQLRVKVKHLEEEVKSQDDLLSDIRQQALSSAEALRTASDIKKELNGVRESEAQLSEQLEQKEEELAAARKELEENLRAQRAEIALKDAERRTRELETEREALLRGVAKRDEALQLMKRELERSAAMLSVAADTREALKAMQAQMESMALEARLKDERLAALQDDFALALRGQEEKQIILKKLVNGHARRAHAKGK